jgi:AcrR family transcriptional regulator
MVSEETSENKPDMAINKPNRMDRRRRETRNKLLAATLKLMVEKGVEKTTMNDISDGADLGRRTFYNHFSSKEECMIAAAIGEIQQHSIKVFMLTANVEDAALVVAMSVQFVMASLAKEPVVRCLVERPRMLGTALFGAIGEFVNRDMERGIEQGRFNPPLRGKLLDNMMKWSLVGLLIEAADSDFSLDSTLVGYSQAFLMILGLQSGEAEEVSKLAAQHLQ